MAPVSPIVAPHLALGEDDVIRLVLEFLQSRSLHISQLSLERETGVINGVYSDDVLFLRQLILDGQWDDVLEFIQPLESVASFDQTQFRYYVLRQKYVELLCIKSEAGPVPNVDAAVEEVVKVLSELEKVCPSKEAYGHLCLLLTLPRLTEHAEYRDWNPNAGRVQCFSQILPLVNKFLPADSTSDSASGPSFAAKPDRLMHLLIKGLLYETCVDFCQRKAVSGPDLFDVRFAHLLKGSKSLSDSDLSLLSWLQCLPTAVFAHPFEQWTLNVDVERLEKPPLETSWTEHMLITPIKPKLFPHSAMPYGRPRSVDLMSRSLNQALFLTEGWSVSTSGGQATGGGASNGKFLGDRAFSAAAAGMSRSSLPSFHLTGKKPMNTSVDRLFENEGSSLAFTTASTYADVHPPPRDLDEAEEGPTSSVSAKTVVTANVSSLNRRELQSLPEGGAKNAVPAGSNGNTGSGERDLLREYQRSKKRQETELVTADIHYHTPTNGVNPAQNRVVPPPPPATSIGNNTQQPRGASPAGHVTSSSAPTERYDQPRVPAPVHGPLSGSGSHSGSGSLGSASGHTSTTTGAVAAPVPVSASGKPRFVAVTSLEDVQAVRCAEFHPAGKLYAVGSNSKTLRICSYPKLADLRDDHSTYQPTVLFKRTKHHKGSIYCLAWSPAGDLIASGSNDKTVKLMRFNADTCNMEGQEVELTMHDGTVRDVCFIEDMSNKSSLLVSGGAGDCKIYVTDCATGTPFQALSGHSGHVLSLHTWGGAMFVSGSQDKTVRMWDLRTRGCVNLITPLTTPSAPVSKGSPVAGVCVDPSGRLLVSGHEDSSCVLYDVRGGRTIQSFRPHTADVRSIRFSPSAYYLLTAGYDNKIVLTDLQGDLTLPLPSIVVAQHEDKVISGRWHPSEFSFLSTSADKTSTLWALPPV